MKYTLEELYSAGIFSLSCGFMNDRGYLKYVNEQLDDIRDKLFYGLHDDFDFDILADRYLSLDLKTLAKEAGVSEDDLYIEMLDPGFIYMAMPSEWKIECERQT